MYGYKEIEKMSIKIIDKINENGIRCSVLTKGILPKVLETRNKKNTYGITLISLNEKFREIMEPGSAPYIDRIESLKYLSSRGCSTWVSIEPYPTPNIIEQDLTEILEMVSFTDKIIFGRLNYNKKVSEYKNSKRYFNELSNFVIEYCAKHKIESYIKKGTISKNLKFIDLA